MQPVNLPVGVFSRAEQRVLQSIFKAIAEGGGRCVATLEMLARDSNTSKSTARNAIARAVAIGLLEKIERRYYGAVSLPNILSPGQLWQSRRYLRTQRACRSANGRRLTPTCSTEALPAIAEPIRIIY
jgi:hypothetical protein